MKGEVTIQSAIDELQRMFKFLNAHYFNNELERPVITILTDYKGGAYGWISVGKVWSSKDDAWFREINLCAEYLNRPAELVITTLQHEMCHLLNLQNGVQDCSRGGLYHNARFRDVAEARGLIVKQHATHGFCMTEPSSDFIELVKANCRAGCFKLERMKTYRDGTPKTTKTGAGGQVVTTSRTKQSYRKYICAACGLIARTTRDAELICSTCQQAMALAE
ncbi:MAG: SprT-like domain-containing protein [Oscillospiraceae bacterium]|jgi:hypothetical protein|nr:SprT-like domain-containing protein [Oscillospiraceae bacterium]